MSLPKQYADLALEKGPRLLIEGLRLMGVKEVPGSGNNPTIMAWAKATGYIKVYTADSIPWCGLGMSYMAMQAGWDGSPKGNALWAANWASWGNPAPDGVAMLADVLVFTRTGGNHVGIYVGEDALYYYVLGCNQDDEVNIKRKLKSQCFAVRRCPWRISQPVEVRRIFRTASGPISANEQ
jgi:uncharacterized protein (TIGR02594 family)